MRWVVLLAALTAHDVASARRLAVVNGAGEAGREAAARVQAAAERGGHAAADGPLVSALAEAVPAAPVGDGAALADAARKDLVRFDYDAVLGRLREAESRASPGRVAADQLAELNFLAGVAHAGMKEDARAIESFRLVRRLDPARTALDPAIYQPRLVRLYQQSGREAAGAPAPLRLEVGVEGATPWIDGQEGARAELAPGEHYLGAIAEGHKGRLLRVRARPGTEVKAKLELSPLAPEEHAARLREAAAADAGGTAARAASLTGADIVVVLRAGAGGAVEAAIWRGGTLGAFGPVADAEGALAARPSLSVADEDPRPGPIDDRPGPGPRPDRPRSSFWTSGWGIAVIAGGLAAVATTAVLIYLGTRDDQFQVGPPCFMGPDCP